MPRDTVSQRWSAIGVVCLLAACVIASFALASAGGPAPVLLRGRTVTLTLDEYSITPRSISLPAGPIRIVAENHGLIAHNLTIEDERLDSRGERPRIATSHPILPGSRRTISLEVPRPGRYLLTSTIANQSDLGMTGTLIVR
jgi:uncharacterized cupredoxin-like copper-binding protein